PGRFGLEGPPMLVWLALEPARAQTRSGTTWLSSARQQPCTGPKRMSAKPPTGTGAWLLSTEASGALTCSWATLPVVEEGSSVSTVSSTVYAPHQVVARSALPT